MKERAYVMSEQEKYLFDLRGYLVVPGALTPDEIDRCNKAIDRFAHDMTMLEPGSLSKGSSALTGLRGRKQLSGMLGWPRPYCDVFRLLLVHPVVVARLNELCDKRFRLDHGPLLIEAEAGAEGHRLHNAGEPFGYSVAYHHQNGRIFCRGVTVAWQLTDVNAGDGGFAIVPGSHKASEPLPDAVASVEEDMAMVVQPQMKAGDVLFFAETATHGTLPWTGQGQRRSVLYKYASHGAARAVGRHFTPEQRYGDWTAQLSAAQRAVLFGPGVHTEGLLPILESDGDTVQVAKYV